MNAIEEQISTIELMKKRSFDISIKELKEHDELLGNLNRRQLSQGIDGNGADMPTYVAKSKKSGKIKLYETGAYTKGIKPLFESNHFEMTSSNEKIKFLDKKYPTSLGLSPISRRVITEELVDDIILELMKL